MLGAVCRNPVRALLAIISAEITNGFLHTLFLLKMNLSHGVLSRQIIRHDTTRQAVGKRIAVITTAHGSALRLTE